MPTNMTVSKCFVLTLMLSSHHVAESFMPPFVSSINKGSFQSTSPSKESSEQKTNQDDSWVSTAFNNGDGATVGPQNVLIYDTSLRDGTQGESVSVTCDDKIKIVNRLCSFGMVDYIECGWPGSNPKDAEFFSRAKTEFPPEIQQKLVAFGSTKRKSVADAKDDPQIQALLESEAPTVCIVAKGHKWQVTDILRATTEENLEMIRDSVSYLISQNRTVFVDLEHFFDGYKFDPEYTLKCAEVAAEAGATGLVLCDTNGGSMPWEIDEITRQVVECHGHGNSGVTVGIHTHNDCGMASANSIVAVRAGAGMVQGTINGIGERTGNADLCTVIPSLALHVKCNMKGKEGLKDISSLSRFVDETLNRKPNAAAPFVGASAFAHKGGLHVAAMERSPNSYQHIDPSLVGNEKRVLVSELSGRQNIMGMFKDFGIELDDVSVSSRATAILNRVKNLENVGYTFEGADASVQLMILHSTEGYCPPFQVLDYSAQVFDSYMDSSSRVLKNGDQNPAEGFGDTRARGSGFASTARATVKVKTLNINQEVDKPTVIDRLEVSDGNGPVDALAKALTRALVPSYPYLANLELVDYKVRILDPENATGATTRVMIEFSDTKSKKTWTTVSVDKNVISASLNALVDGYEFAMIEHATECMLLEP